MSRRRLTRKARNPLPPTIEQLVAGRRIEDTPENRELLVEACYFGWSTWGLTEEQAYRACATVRGWRDKA